MHTTDTPADTNTTDETTDTQSNATTADTVLGYASNLLDQLLGRSPLFTATYTQLVDGLGLPDITSFVRLVTGDYDDADLDTDPNRCIVHGRLNGNGGNTLYVCVECANLVQVPAIPGLQLCNQCAWKGLTTLRGTVRVFTFDTFVVFECMSGCESLVHIVQRPVAGSNKTPTQITIREVGSDVTGVYTHIGALSLGVIKYANSAMVGVRGRLNPFIPDWASPDHSLACRPEDICQVIHDDLTAL